MPSQHFSRTGQALPDDERDPLNQALQDLGQLMGSVMPLNTPVPVEIFKTRYSSVLEQADRDGAALISQGAKRYVIVSEAHFVALARDKRATRSVADICMSLPPPRQSVDLSFSQMSGSRGDIDVRPGR